MNIRKSNLAPALFSLALSFMLLTGCSQENSMAPTPTTQLDASADVAESVATAVGEESGGVMDLVGDIFELTAAIQLGKATNDGFLDHREASYDEATGTWTLIVQRERGVPGDVPYGYWDRIFTYQFFNAAGEVQKFYVTDGDTARTINFNVIEGDGYHKNFRLAHDLKSIQGAFVATNTHAELITVNGTYARAAVDTITTKNFTRTSDHTLDVTVIDLVGPRDSFNTRGKLRRNLAQKVSGRITGTFHADIVFDGERGYAEKTVDKEIDIVIGDGEAEIVVGGRKYMSNIRTGQVE